MDDELREAGRDVERTARSLAIESVLDELDDKATEKALDILRERHEQGLLDAERRYERQRDRDAEES